MNGLASILLALSVLSAPALGKQHPPSASTQQAQGETASSAAPQGLKVMREFRGVKLGLKAEEVRALMGKPARDEKTSEEYKLGDDDLLTIHYDQGAVKAIQLFFSKPDRAPAWTDVIGQADVTEREDGAKHARVVVDGEKFWVAMYQSKSGTVTTITISR